MISCGQTSKSERRRREAEAFLTDSVTIYEESVQQGDPDMAEMFGQPALDKVPKRAVVDRAAPDTASGADTSEAGGAPPSGGTTGDFEQESS